MVLSTMSKTNNMKKTVLTIIAIIVLTSINAQEKPKRIKLKGVTIQNDYHENISWVNSKNVSLNSRDYIYFGSETSCYMQLYFGIKEVNGKPFLIPIRLKNSFYSDSWIFFDEISYLFGSRKEIRAGKGVRFKITTSGKRKVGNGISEKSTITVIGETKSLIEHILNNEPTRLSIRYKNVDDAEVVDIVVYPKTMKKLKKHFQALIKSYNQLDDAYKLNSPF